MERPSFKYNNASASCHFCNRTHNPHPEFQHEPIVTTWLMVNQKEQEVCINCYYEMLEVAKSLNTSLPRVLEQKVNLLRIFNKQNNRGSCFGGPNCSAP